MCAIFGSFSKEKLLELAKINSDRGNFSYSITAIGLKTRSVLECIKGFGEFVPEFNFENAYYICHIQAPTSATTQDLRRVHPSVIQHPDSDITYLWHNGVLKHDWYTKSSHYDPELSWDTDVLHREFTELFSNIENVDGQFSCVYQDKSGIFMLRNSEAPMFIDDDMNISSTYYDGARSTLPGHAYEFNFEEKKFDDVWQFKCKSQSYYFGDEE
jgi:hypothetical protein